MLTDAERAAIDHLRLADEGLRAEQAAALAGQFPIPVPAPNTAEYAECYSTIATAKAAVYAMAGKRDEDNVVQAEYLGKVVAGLEVAQLDAATADVTVDERTGEITVKVKPDAKPK